MKSEEIEYILSNASVPEHSAEFMQAMSGGEIFLEGNYLFIAGGDWLLAIGYPLENIPISRITDFLRNCHSWERFIRRNVRAYLKADLDGMFGTSIEFPTRTEAVIQRRDSRFLYRMKPYIEAGSAAVFVGSAHMINLPGMLADAGFRVRRCR